MNLEEDLKNRERKINVEALSKEEADILIDQIGNKIAKEFEGLYSRLRPMLKIYGLDITLHYVVHPAGQNAADFISKNKTEESETKEE